MIILKDTREQTPWSFDCEQITRKLYPGDYSIEGYEHLFAIERKSLITELAGNITEDRFERELVDLGKMQHAFLICEFGWKDISMYPNGTDLPAKVKARLRVRGPYILRRLNEIQVQYGINLLLCDNRDRAQFVAYDLMKRAYDYYHTNEIPPNIG